MGKEPVAILQTDIFRMVGRGVITVRRHAIGFDWFQSRWWGVAKGRMLKIRWLEAGSWNVIKDLQTSIIPSESLV
jgi:hypothetical protein